MTGERSNGGRVSSRDRREQFLAAAAALAVADGVDAVTMEAVASGVGVNKALLYRQFSNRGELLLALYRDVMFELDRRLVDAVAEPETFEDKTRAWVRAWFDYVATHGRLMYRLQEARVVAGQVERPHRDRQRRWIGRYGEWYARHLGLDGDVARDAAAIITAGLNGVAERWAGSPNRPTMERLEATFVDMVLGGLERLAERTTAGRTSRTGGPGGD